VSGDHMGEARKLLHPDDKGSGWAPPPTPEEVAIAQVHVLMQIAGHLGDISAELTMLREGLSSRG
jgi:hypothetical protein